MPQKAITCTVELDTYTVTCPGTLHLSDRNMVFLLVNVFGQVNRTKSVFATFPLNFNERMVFERTFTGVSEPTEVVELLEDERVKLELRQYSEVHKGGKLLARYEQTGKEFLYPTPTLTGKDGLEREVLLSRTAYFNGIDPKLEFASTSTMQEVTVPGLAIPPTSSLDESQSEESDESTDTEDEVVVLPPSSSFITEEHCVCECPRRPENMGMVVPKSRSTSPTRRPRSASPTGRPPFKAGRADTSIISRRDFGSSRRNRQKLFFPAEGDPMPCVNCQTPHQDCIVCQAYYKVFGRDFLKHRFQAKGGHQRTVSTPAYTSFAPASEPPKIRTHRYIEDNEDPLYQSRAYSEPIPRTKPRFLSTPKPLDISYRIPSPSDQIHDRVERIVRRHSPLPAYRSYIEESDSDDDSLLSLQELRSEINSARLESLDRSFEDPGRPTLGTRLDRSITVPLSKGKYWSNRKSAYTGRSHRDMFDESMEEVYEDMYDRASR